MQPTSIEQCLVFLYLNFAHLTDGVLKEEEIQMLKDKVKKWRPDAELDTDKLLVNAKNWLNDSGEQNSAHEEPTESFRAVGNMMWTTFEQPVLHQILQDLIAVAKADNLFHENEENWVRELCERWGIEYGSL